MTSDAGAPLPESGSAHRAGGKPRRVDAMAVGRSILGPVRPPAVVEVSGYGVLGFAGQGGLGQVWHARRLRDGREVALKLTTEADPEMEERLAIEAETLRSLRHPHIVELLDFTTSREGHAVLVMEWVDGPNLAVHLPDRGFDFDHALQIYLPVLEAVAYAHGQGIIHRDLKPSNILLTSAGVPKVSDFGLARSLNQRKVAFSMTRSGAVAGTVEYLAPECYRPDYQPSKAADLYALGVLLYEILTGAPPRGAWQPLSQVKPLDVRLDELIAALIHPDPARRPVSALAVRARLEEIRDSRPRLSGTPLVTPAVRAADLGWTVLGLYVCAAGFCSTLSQTRTPVPALLDLRFGCSGLLIAGFLAVWVLSLGIGVLSIWQMFRLWRFRNVPLREALPQPFGARLGRSRLTAWLVGGAQVFIFALPPLFTLTTAFHALHWWTPETPVWQHSLVVTPWMTDEPVSPWRWDPSGFLDGGKYWLKEADAGFDPGTLRVQDRTSFFVFVQPAAMVLAAVLTGMCAILTFVMAARQWWPRRLGLLLLPGLSGLVVAAAALQWHFDATRSVRERKSTETSRNSKMVRMWELADLRLRPLFDSLIRHRSPPADGDTLANVFSPEFSWVDDTIQTPASLGAWAAADRMTSLREHRTAEKDQFHALRRDETKDPPKRNDWNKEFIASHSFFEYRHPQNDRVEAAYRRIVWQGTIRGSSRLLVTRVRQTLLPFYAAEVRGITPPEAASWLTAFLAAFAEAGCPALENFFHTSLFSERPRWRVFPATEVTSVLRKERERWLSLQFTLREPLPPATPGAGGWWELRPVLRPQGIRAGGTTDSTGTSLTPTIDVAWIDGAWRIIQFGF